MIRFLSLAEVLLIYEDQVRRYGGIYRIRDVSLLSSAVYAPKSSYEGRYLHASIPSMAAAYAYHISQNHALLDGNKRVALSTALVFLELNGYEFNCPEEKLYQIMMKVAKSELKKERLIDFFENHAEKRWST